MSWSTTVSWVDPDQNEHHLMTWHGRELFGYRTDKDEWFGNLPEESVISSELRSGFPDRYEVTVQGVIDGLHELFSETYRKKAATDHLYTDADALERELKELPEGTLIRLENWDQS